MRIMCLDQPEHLRHDQAWVILLSGWQTRTTKGGGTRDEFHKSTVGGTDDAAWYTKLHLPDWNWNVKPIVQLNKFFYCLVSMLAKTINECENKSRVYNTEMPLALVSPHFRCLKHYVYFFSQPFCIECLKKREREKKNTIIEALPLFDYTDCIQ